MLRIALPLEGILLDIVVPEVWGRNSVIGTRIDSFRALERYCW